MKAKIFLLTQACLIPLGLLAQNNADYNPDYNGDGFIGVDDILGALSFYNTSWDSPNDDDWICGDSLEYLGYFYSTVLIDNRCWFAENLRNEGYSNGDPIPAELSDDEWNATISGAVAVHGEGETSCTSYSQGFDACNSELALSEYGRLYNWYAVIDDRGLCPSNWHVPSDIEWTVLVNFLGGDELAGGQMKSATGWSEDGNGTNLSGFSGLPGGFRISNFSNYAGYWWSSSSDDSNAWYRSLVSTGDQVNRGEFNQKNGFSVRCIENTAENMGCTDVEGCNYDELAVFDDGSCEYDSCVEVPCGSPLHYNGYDYATVLIGEQCWLAENLRTDHYRDGEPIEANLSNGEWANSRSGATAVYGEGSGACDNNSLDGNACDENWSIQEFGRLYNWHAVNDVRGLCPSGWHVPDNDDWSVLFDELGGVGTAADPLKAVYSWQAGGVGNNSSGFSALPGGGRGTTGVFYGNAYYGHWWSSDELGEEAAHYRLHALSDDIDYLVGALNSGFSVRCVQDSE